MRGIKGRGLPLIPLIKKRFHFLERKFDFLGFAGVCFLSLGRRNYMFLL